MRNVSLGMVVMLATAVWGCSSDESGTATPGDTSPFDADDTAGQTAAPDSRVGGDSDGVYVAPSLVEIVGPAHGATVEGSITVRLEAVSRDAIELDHVTLRVEGVAVFTDVKLPTDLVLDTRQHPTGRLALEATAQRGFEQGRHQISVTVANPPLRFAEVTPEVRWAANGRVVSVLVTMEGPPDITVTGDFSALDSDYDPERVAAYVIGGGTYSVSYIMSTNNTRPDGVYPIPLTASVAAWEISYDQLSLAVRNTPTNPTSITTGIFADARLPPPTAGWAVIAPKVETASEFIVTGGSVPLTVDLSDYAQPQDIVGVIIGLEGMVGTYQVPIEGSTTTLDLTLFLRSFSNYESVPPVLPLRVAVRDVRGRVSPYGTALYGVKAVGSGDVQVSLNWDTATDVDLHVIDPTGCELYYGHRSCGAGELDLDSNPGCSIDHINNENVFYPVGQAPPGQYTVRVDFYSDCCSCGANYTLTVHACGRIEVYEGTFAPNDDDHGGAGDGVTVAQFSNAVCTATIAGRVRYSDRDFDETGFGARTWRPVRNALVELLRLRDNEVVGVTTTDQDGRYDLRFTNEGEPGLIVRVKARSDAASGLRDIKILDHPKFKRLYEVTSPPIVFGIGETEKIQDIDITEDLGAGAFNIFDVFQRGYDLIRVMTGATLGELTGFWATGADTTDTIYCSQFLYNRGQCTELGSVSVQGKDTDRDEYDDMVILKEFFKFALTGVSRDDHPGGAARGVRDDPRRAWSEGVTTFFASDVLERAYFVDSRPHGVTLVEEMEDQRHPFSFGTDDGRATGKTADTLTSALLWDLADRADSEVVDQVEGMRNGIYDTLFNYLPSTRYADRGSSGVDLVDFLDGWFCRGWERRSAVEAIVVDHRHFPYDFAGPAGCAQQ